MCGSGTILCEAAMIASNRPPQKINRNFTFMKWKNFNSELYEQVCNDAVNGIIHSNLPPISGEDKIKSAVQAAMVNITEAGLSDLITVEQNDFYHDGAQNTTLIFNPPYDARLKEDDVTDFYKHIGDKLKMSFKNCTAWIISGHLDALKHVGLRPSSKKALLNGEIPSLFCKYEMYEGSKKKSGNKGCPMKTKYKLLQWVFVLMCVMGLALGYQANAQTYQKYKETDTTHMRNGYRLDLRCHLTTILGLQM